MNTPTIGKSVCLKNLAVGDRFLLPNWMCDDGLGAVYEVLYDGERNVDTGLVYYHSPNMWVRPLEKVFDIAGNIP